MLVLFYPVQGHPSSRLSGKKKLLLSRSEVHNNSYKGPKAWIGRKSNQVQGRTLLRRRLVGTHRLKLKSMHGNIMGKLRCIKRRKKEDENRMRRCEKRKVAVASEVEEKCSGKDVQGCAKNRKIRRKRKGDGGGSYKRNEIKGTKRSGNTKVKASAEKVKRERCGKQERQKCFSKGGKGRSGRRNKKIPGQ